MQECCHVRTHHLCASLWVTHLGPKPRVGIAITVSTSNTMLKWCVMLHPTNPCEPFSIAEFIFSPILSFEVSFTSHIQPLRLCCKWHFKDGQTLTRLPYCPKSNNNGCTIISQYKNLQKSPISEFQLSSLIACKCLSRVLKGFPVPAASWALARYLFSSSANKSQDSEVQPSNLHVLKNNVSISLKKEQRSLPNQFCNLLLSSPIYPMVVERRKLT